MQYLTTPFLSLELLSPSRQAAQMKQRYVFGYGSLVNKKTHDYADLNQASLSGWQRVWRHVKGRNVAFLTVQPDENTVIDGLIAAVPDGSWRALDEREHAYLREIAQDVIHPLVPETDVQFYHAPASLHAPADQLHPILLSYLDAVIQGFHSEFGQPGVTRFFETTFGWDAPILDDRNAPIYPRHQALTDQELQLVDDHLAAKGIQKVSPKN